MINGNKKDKLNKKKGQPDGGLIDRIYDRRMRLLNHRLTYRQFANEYGYRLAMVTHAILETRKSPLTLEIQKKIATLPLPGESGQANREM